MKYDNFYDKEFWREREPEKIILKKIKKNFPRKQI
jgi:hypothetical protein